MTKPTKEREIVLDILLEVLEKGGYSHVILGQALSKYQYLDKQNRAFITRVVEGTIEYKLTIDAVLDTCSRVKTAKMKPVIRTILRMSVYQILWMDRVPDSAACDEAVKLTVQRHLQGLKGFVNGVLRTVARQKGSFEFKDWSKKYSMPIWIIDLWKGHYPSPVVEGMLRYFLEDKPTCVRCNLDRADRETVIESLKAQGVNVQPHPLAEASLLLSGYDYLESLEAFREGWIQVQDVSSSFVGAAADPQPGAVILDVCGAPGGKSLHLADLLKGTGEVVVRDLTEAKVALIEENISRSGFTNIRAQQWDALEYDPDWEQRADILIADLPCSGLGIIGKKPDIKYQASRETITELAKLQQQILSVAASYVKPGGRLVYSTCTISPQENENQREWFLSHFPFEPVSIQGRLGNEVKEETMKEGYVQLLPGVYPCDGFFLAVFERKA